MVLFESNSLPKCFTENDKTWLFFKPIEGMVPVLSSLTKTERESLEVVSGNSTIYPLFSKQSPDMGYQYLLGGLIGLFWG